LIGGSGGWRAGQGARLSLHQNELLAINPFQHDSNFMIILLFLSFVSFVFSDSGKCSFCSHTKTAVGTDGGKVAQNPNTDDDDVVRHKDSKGYP
jgi:hypothetical protein